MPETLDTKATALWSLETVLEYLELTAGDADNLVIQIANRVTDEFERRTGRPFVLRTVTERWSGRGESTRFLKYAPAASLTSLTIDGATIDPSLVFLDSDLALIELCGSCFTRGTGNCTAVYQAGYGAQDDGEALPSDIFEAGLEQVKAIYDERKNGSISATSVTVGPMSLVVKPGMAYNIKNVLDGLRDMRA